MQLWLRVFCIGAFCLGGLLALPARGAEQVDYVQRLVTESRRLGLAREKAWLRLGHYRRGVFGGWSSEVVGPAFFLSPDGNSDPAAELEATLREFFREGERAYPSLYAAQGPTDSQHPRCQFPARWRWLRERLEIDESRMPPVDCARFAQFRARLGARSVSVVFSSYYLNNPSSAFGHSFLRINKAPLEEAGSSRHELLDFGLNFAAEVTSDNALVYAVLGLAGGFRGTYSHVPYYYKVREYNDFESRDLWSYDLRLTAPEVETLVEHLWELGATYHRYFYLSQNCSYQILTAVEAAAPRLDLTQPLPFYVIPSDTIRRLMEVPGLVERVGYRPSARAQFAHRWERLSEPERFGLVQVIEAGGIGAHLDGLTSESRVRVLDAALDFADYRYARELRKEGSSQAAWKQELLMARARAGARGEPLVIQPSDEIAPHLGHESARWTLGLGSQRSAGPYAHLGIRFALHDLLDPGTGYPEHAQIEFGHLNGRYFTESRRLRLEELTLIRVTSLSPLSAISRERSWRVELGARRDFTGNCAGGCVPLGFELGSGYAVSATRSLTAFAFAEVGARYSSGFLASNVQLGAGPAIGAVWIGGRFNASAQAGYRWLAFARESESYRAQFETRWLAAPGLAVGLQGVAQNRMREASLQVFRYF